MKNYRLSVDDNIRVFKSLATARQKSIFDNEYMAMWKALHDKYKTKIQLNIYYEMDGFNLSMMPDIWREEWESNSDWLRLSFHSRANDPPSPYQNSGYDEVYDDCTLIHKEILRFAGEKTLSYFTTVHYTDPSAEGRRALHDCGIKGLVGLFGTHEKSQIAYSLSAELSEKIRKKDFYFDEETDMWYFCNDMVINGVETERLEEETAKLYGQNFVEVMIHEQYFHREYSGFLPDFVKRLEIVLNGLSKHGFAPCFLEDAV